MQRGHRALGKNHHEGDRRAFVAVFVPRRIDAGNKR